MSTTASDYMAYTIWMLEEMAKNYKEYLEPQAVYLAVVLFMQVCGIGPQFCDTPCNASAIAVWDPVCAVC